MATYKEYLLSLIDESSEDDMVKDTIIEMLESAETMVDLDEIESYIVEGLTPRKMMDIRDRVGTAAARKAGGGWYDYVQKNGVLDGEPYWDEKQESLYASNHAYNKATTNFDRAVTATAAIAFISSLIYVIKKVKSKTRKVKSRGKITNKADKLDEQAKELVSKCKSGDITPKEAMDEAKKLKIQTDKLVETAEDAIKSEENNSKEDELAKESAVIGLITEIFEACERGDIAEDDRDNLLIVLEEAEAKDMTLKEQLDAGGASTASDDGKNINNEYELKGFEEIEKKLIGGIDTIGEGDIEKGSRTCLSACTEAIVVYTKVLKQIDEADDIKTQITELREDVENLKKECKSGDITASDAKTLANKIRVKMKLIAKKIKSSLHKERTKTTTESVLGEIFENVTTGILYDDAEIRFLVESACMNEAEKSVQELTDILLEAKKATTEGEKKSLQERMFTKYYTGLDKVSEKGARKFTPVADKAAGKEGRIANNTDYDAYYKKYSDTKKKVKVGALGASIAVTAGVIPGAGVPVIAPIFAAGAKYSPNPDDAKMIDSAVSSFKKAVSSIFKGKSSGDIDVNGATVAANNVKAAIKDGKRPDQKDIRLFDITANKINALAKKGKPAHAMESVQNLDDIRLLLEGCIGDPDLDNAISTMTVIIEAYDFMDDEINDMFDVAETAIDLRLD